MQKKIGVFDSGVGGLSVARALEKALPDYQIVFRNDAKHVPYGNKTNEDIYKLCLPIIKSLENDGCPIIVIACNTVTTNLINKLRSEIKVPLIGMEPMVKPAAALTKTRVITVCATPRTLQSRRYGELKDLYADGIKVIEPDCSDWTLMIENNQVDKGRIQAIVDESKAESSDVIVLGCTHYHWIEELIKSLAGENVTVLQPELPVIRQVKKTLGLD